MLLQDIIVILMLACCLFIGACITYNLSEECTHVLADELMPVKEHLVDAIVSKKPIVLRSWVEVLV